MEKEVKKETDVDFEDPDYENLEEEDDNDDEFEKPKKKRNYLHYPRTTAAALRFGISTFALTVLIWAYNMGKEVLSIFAKPSPKNYHLIVKTT